MDDLIVQMENLVRKLKILKQRERLLLDIIHRAKLSPKKDNDDLQDIFERISDFYTKDKYSI